MITPEVKAPTVTGTENASLSFCADNRDRRERRTAIYDHIADKRARWVRRNAYYYRQINRLVGSLVPPGARVLEVGCGLGDLLASLRASRSVGIDISPRTIELARVRHPELDLHVCDAEKGPLPQGPFDWIVLSDTVGHLDDVQCCLENLAPLLAPDGHVVITYYNFLWEPLLKLGEKIGLKTAWPDQNWLSRRDLMNLLYLSNYEVVRKGTDVLVPFRLPVLAELANRVISRLPIARSMALVQYVVGRPMPRGTPERLPSTSIVCPCRNEKGNIRAAVERVPVLGPYTELIFVDGNSTDGTVEEIEAAMRDYQGPLTIRLIQQGQGKGKGDAVRKGFAAARGEVLMILDSDLTVPPEELPKFYWALVSGKGDFINGVRLVYPMEGEAMRLLNLAGNKFFGLALSWILEQAIKDSLCGTKVLYRRAYDNIAQNRAFFGEFDPFGDFDLLFGAARLSLKILDLPVRYRARRYGDTKISRFRHGWLLLKMTAFSFRRFRMG